MDSFVSIPQNSTLFNVQKIQKILYFMNVFDVDILHFQKGSDVCMRF